MSISDARRCRLNWVSWVSDCRSKKAQLTLGLISGESVVPIA